MKLSTLDAASAAFTAYQETLVQLADAAAVTTGWEAQSTATREQWIAFVNNVVNATANPVSADAAGVGTLNSDKANAVATAVVNSLREFHG